MNHPGVTTVPVGETNSLAAFVQAVQAHNPFLDNRVNAPSASEPDVASIHQAAFQRLTALASEALQAHRGLGAVLWGEAGIGKSHLLSRMGRWADGRACFVYLHNLQADPHSLPRSLLRAVVSILTLGQRRAFYRTPLFTLVHGAVVENLPAGQRRFTWGQVEHAFHTWIDRLGRQNLPGSTLLDRKVDDVLFRFFRSACEFKVEHKEDRAAQLAVRWLSGDALDPDEAKLLELPPGPGREDPVCLADNQQIKQVLVALTRLARIQQRPFVLAFDQVDNLDAEQFAALARFLEALIDSSPNLLVITAGIQASLLGWREQRVIQDSAWDRLAQFEVPLQRVNSDEAAQIVRVRLQSFLQPFASLPAITGRTAADPLFPLGREWYQQHLQDKQDFRPRDVINRAGDGWRQLQERLRQPDGLAGLTGPGQTGLDVKDEKTPAREFSEEEIRELIDSRVRESMADLLAQRHSQQQSLPPDEDRLVQLIYDLLCQCRDQVPSLGVVNVTRTQTRAGAQPAHQLQIAQHRPGEQFPFRTGLLVITANNRTSVANSLRRLVSGTDQVDRQVLVTDERVGLQLGPQGENYLATLEQGGPHRLVRLELTFSEYAELDSLHLVVGLGHAGELEIEPNPGEVRKLTEREVIESLQRQGRYLGSRLLRELLDPAHLQEPAQT